MSQFWVVGLGGELVVVKGWREGTGTYGPMSDGVTGSEGGGGRLIRVGVADMLAIVTACV